MKLKFLFIAYALISPILMAFAQNKIKKPNIVVFLVDDMGWQDTSVPFWNKTTPLNRKYHTPNMEKLAAMGTKFTQAYATPVCSPSRISLMTGMNASRHRVTNWTLKKDMLQPMEVNHPTLKFPEWHVNGLSQDAKTPLATYAKPISQLLQEQGYYTIHAGKAHFGAIDTPGESPLNLGFDVNIAGHAAGAPQSYEGLENFGNGLKGKELWAVPGLEKYHGKDIFLTEALTQEALLALNQRPKHQPFYLYLSHYAVHTPLYGDKRFLQKYLNNGLDIKEAKYASMIEGMDKSLGDVMHYLEHHNLLDQTIILFMSDNGGLSVQARGGKPNTHNKPLNSGKGSMYEGGIRVPMLAYWPNVSKANSTVNKIVSIEDFFPTIAEIAQVKTDVPQVIDGQSFVPLLKGKTNKFKERPLIWHYPNEWGPTGPGIGAASVIRMGSWKLIYYHANQNIELLNLTNDIGESKNLVSIEKQKVKMLAKTLADYLRMVDAQMPVYKSNGEVIPWPDELQ